MKIQTDGTLIQDMNLKAGERFRIVTGKKSFVMEYVGTREENGTVYDVVKPVKDA
jgi:hypothetical protein